MLYVLASSLVWITLMAVMRSPESFCTPCVLSGRMLARAQNGEFKNEVSRRSIESV